MQLPEEIIVLLGKAAHSNGLPLEMWKAENGDRILSGFFDLASLLAQSGLDLSGLPSGYALLATIFRWEAECQCESWNAFEWTNDVNAVIQAYTRLGLGEEAAAIERAAHAWRNSDGNYDTTLAAYGNGLNPYSNEELRLEYIVDYCCANADDLFYVRSTAS